MSERKGKYALWKPLVDNIAICIVVDDEAKRIDQLDEETIKDEIEEHLRLAFSEYEEF